LGAVNAVLRARKQRVLTEDQMLKAWLQLDKNNMGYITLDRFIEVFMKHGEPFSQ
jgi:Ca2+-binding EF-hand superfamily protein